MPRITQEIQEDKLEDFFNHCMDRVRERYRSLTIENRTWDNPPRINISHKNKEGKTILCKITYGDYGKMEYSLNWYVNDKRAQLEVNDSNEVSISIHLLFDAQTFFKDVATRAPPPSYDSVLEQDARRKNVEFYALYDQLQKVRPPPPPYDEAWGNDFERETSYGMSSAFRLF